MGSKFFMVEATISRSILSYIQLARPLLLLSALFLSVFVVKADRLSRNEAAKILPERVGDFHSISELRAPSPDLEKLAQTEFTAKFGANRIYRSVNGEEFSVTVIRTASD